MSTINNNKTQPHIAVVMLAGVGHLTPLLRVASMLLSRDCKITLVTAKSFVSASETNHISFFCKVYPQVKHLEFEPAPAAAVVTDPFLIQYDAISRSGDSIRPLLLSLFPRAAAIFCDLIVASGVAEIAASLSIPYYTVFTSSARFLSLSYHLPVLASNNENLKDTDEVEIPGLNMVSMLSIPRPFLDPNHLLGRTLVRNIRALSKARGILVNTFDSFEAKALFALNNGMVSHDLPPVLAIGPLESYELVKDQSQSQCLAWLDKQPAESVVYVNFGSRTATPPDQIKELKNALETSGCRFLWVIKTTVVDKDDKDDLKTILCESFLERTKEVGMVVKGWVNQQEVLAHPAIAGFMSHCGWNSVTESALHGVPILAWPQAGDQMINSEVVEKAGLGVLRRTRGPALGRLVKAEEIFEMITQLDENPSLRLGAKKLGEEAKKAIGFDGSSSENIRAVISSLTT